MERPVIAEWLRRRAATIGLLRNPDFRRNQVLLLALNLRGVLTRGFLGLVLLLTTVGYLVAEFYTTDPAGAMDLLQLLFGAAAIGAGANLYSADRDSGTFELLWLATGSEWGLLRLKLTTWMIAFLLLSIPPVLFFWSFLGREFSPSMVIVQLMVQSFFLLCLMAYAGTWLPQSWAAGLLMGAFAATLFFTFQGTTTALSPFLNPYVGAAGKAPLGVNRVMMIFGGILLLGGAAKRLRQSL